MRRVLFVVLSLAARPLAAQSRASMDFTVGAGTSRGGRYSDREAAHVELVLVPEQSGRRIVGLTVGGFANPASGDSCVIDPPTYTGCRPQFPALLHAGVLVGADLGPIRAMAGPAAYFGQGSPGVGAQGSVDLAAGFDHLAALVAARGSLVRRRGETLRIGSVELGFRIR